VVVICGDTAVSFRELDELRTEGQRLVGVLDPELFWLSHQHEPWRPQVASTSERERARPSGRRSARGMGRVPCLLVLPEEPDLPRGVLHRSLLVTSMIS
jgi:hypothetical protein